jgi:hypothetical protein
VTPSPSLALFFDACAKGDVDVLRGLLAKDASLCLLNRCGLERG